MIVKTDHPLLRVAEAHHHRRVRARSQTEAPATTVVAGFLPLGHLLFTQCIEALARTLAIVGIALRNQLLDDLAIAVETARLVERALVAVEPQPGHAVEDRLHRLGCRALEIGIFDA
jgi:hypothetical protein